MIMDTLEFIVSGVITKLSFKINSILVNRTFSKPKNFVSKLLNLKLLLDVTPKRDIRHQNCRTMSL